MISVRDAKESDTEKFLEYEFSTPGNLFDPASGLYPTSFTMVAENGQTPIVFLPIQTVFLLESLGINPAASNKEIAVSLRKLINAITDFAETKGIGEIGFVCAESSTEQFAIRHGFEKMPWNFYRLKVAEYRPKNAPEDSANIPRLQAEWSGSLAKDL